MRLWSGILAALLCAVGTACGTDGGEDGGTKVEDCSNGVDDTGNGLTDCDDPACASEAACGAGDQCLSQTACFSANKKYSDYINNTDPMPQCVQKKCETPEANADVNFYITKNFIGTSIIVNSVNTRFVKKLDLNGEPVTCAQLEQVASSNAPEGADAIEKTGKYNLQAYDVTNIQGDNASRAIEIPLMNVMTGSDFIIWTELWSGKKGTNSGLPTGKRYAWGCVESGPHVAEVKPSDHGTRNISVNIPKPQNP